MGRRYVGSASKARLLGSDTRTNRHRLACIQAPSFTGPIRRSGRSLVQCIRRGRVGDPTVVAYQSFDKRPGKLQVRHYRDSKFRSLSSYDILITQDQSRLSLFLVARYVDDKLDLFAGQVVENVRLPTLSNLVKRSRFYSFARELFGCMSGRVNSVPVLREQPGVWDYSLTSFTHADEDCIALPGNVEVAGDKRVDESILEGVSEARN